jgi:hypothetical protein
MATKNNWLKTNIADRLTNPAADFKVWHEVEQIESLTWEQALFDTITDFSWISKKLYIPLSGGMDSEFVFDCLKHLYPTPIIVETPGNKLESSYAFHYCRKHNLNPVVIQKTEAEMLHIYYEDIFTKLNGYGSDSVAVLVAARYAEEMGGVAVIGEHAYDGVSEWDFYNDVLIHEDNSIYFFMWTPELVKAMQNEYHEENHQEFKHRLYDVSFRPKLNYDYSVQYKKALAAIRNKRVRSPVNKSNVVLQDQSDVNSYPNHMLYLKNDTTNEIFDTKAKIIRLETSDNLSFHISSNFDKADWSIEPALSLQEMYRIRAQQIRDSYDYVVLYFSGGSDSITALNAFIKNNINIDEVVVYTNTDTDDTKINGSYAISYIQNVGYKGFVNVLDLNFEVLSKIVDQETWKNYECFSGLLHSVYRWRLDFYEEQGYFDKRIRQGNVAHVFSGMFPTIIRTENDYYSLMDIRKIMHSDANPNNVQFFTSNDAPELHIKQSHVLARTIINLDLEKEHGESASHKLAIRDEYELAVSSAKNSGLTNKDDMDFDSQHRRLMKVYTSKPDFIKKYDSVLDHFNSFNTIELNPFGKKYFLFSEQ